MNKFFFSGKLCISLHTDPRTITKVSMRLQIMRMLPGKMLGETCAGSDGEGEDKKVVHFFSAVDVCSGVVAVCSGTVATNKGVPILIIFCGFCKGDGGDT
ncbi:hypothetical protein P8452_73824 [Trifolium repens]|nr:hypothetical protein P8452_73824 [Trifolium repens]